ncbi:MAG: hypothetical protein NTY95_17860 [Bacteroidia bacterium]|jgi:hypothetical protein|nr:hypothetical protein [Bacteroidia bacterium]
MKKAKLVNNNDLTEEELWQLLLDALMIHSKDQNAKMLEVFDTSFTYELTTGNDDFTYYQVEYTINPSDGLNIAWTEAEQFGNI